MRRVVNVLAMPWLGDGASLDWRLARGNYAQFRFTARWRSASFWCRVWGAGCRAIWLPFSCCRGTRLAPAEWPAAPSHREFARPSAVIRRARFVAAPEATGFLRAALSRQ